MKRKLSTTDSREIKNKSKTLSAIDKHSGSKSLFSDEEYVKYSKYIDVIFSFYDTPNISDVCLTIEKIVNKCYLSIKENVIGKINKKCVVIPIYENIIPLDHFQAIYGKTVFNDPVNAVLIELINIAKEHKREGYGWWTDYIFDPSIKDGKKYCYDFNLEGIRVRKIDLYKGYGQYGDCEEHKYCWDCESYKKKMKSYHSNPLFIFGFSIGNHDEGREWAVIDVESIMPSFENRWVMFYNGLVKFYFSSQFCFSCSSFCSSSCSYSLSCHIKCNVDGNDENNTRLSSVLCKETFIIILDYIGEWLIDTCSSIHDYEAYNHHYEIDINSGNKKSNYSFASSAREKINLRTYRENEKCIRPSLHNEMAASSLKEELPYEYLVNYKSTKKKFEN